MKLFRLILLLGLLGVAFIFNRQHAAVSASTADNSQVSWSTASDPSESETAIPKKALEVLEIVRRTGQPPEGYVGGRVFENREGRLPADGDYREFDVDPHRGERNAERLVIEWRTKKAWYTGDHYRTFIPVP